MASNFDPNESDTISEINITPFVDVVLVLLVIFMVTAPMMVKEAMNIKLPKGKSTERSAARTLGISISKAGQILINGELIDAKDLEERARKAKAESPDVQALISADKLSTHGKVIEVLDALKKADLNNFAFQVEKILDEE